MDRLSRDLADTAGLYRQLAYWSVRTRDAGGWRSGQAAWSVSRDHLKPVSWTTWLKRPDAGQTGRVKAGRIPGGRCYGYDVEVKPGRGQADDQQSEAALVRRIFAEYVNGRSPLKIVQALNAEGIPGPRGGPWNASALLGSAKRRNGLLNNSLYAGQITYNRQSFIKDPATGKRQARANPPDQWITKDVPSLAIVSAELWQAAQDRRAALGRRNRSTTDAQSTSCRACFLRYLRVQMIVRNREASHLLWLFRPDQPTGLCQRPQRNIDRN